MVESEGEEVIEHCGHCPQVEAAERVAELLDGFPAALDHVHTPA